jgi:hypothetical protein
MVIFRLVECIERNTIPKDQKPPVTHPSSEERIQRYWAYQPNSDIRILFNTDTILVDALDRIFGHR